MSGAAALARLLPDFGPARDHPAFRRLLAGGLLSSLGGSMTSFAVVLQVWDLSRSSLAVGLLGLTFVPVLVVGLLGGSAADVVDRRKLALVTSVGLMAVSAMFAAQAYAGLGLLWPLYLLAMVQAVLQAASAPARRTFVPRLVRPDQLTAAIALNTLSGRITMLFGPALAGLIAAAWGLKTCYAVDTVSFVASLYATARLPAMRPCGHRGRSAGRRRRSLAGGRRGTAVHRPPAAARRRVPDRPGRHAARPAGGAVPGAERGALRRLAADARAAQRGRRRRRAGLRGARRARPRGSARQGRGMLAGTMIWGAAIAVFGVTRSLPAALLMLAVAGGADTLTVTFRSAMVQAVTPDEFRGRVSSVEYIIGTGGGPLGNVESGTVASLTTPAVSAVSGGLGCLAIAALIGLLCPAFTRYRRHSAGSPG